MDTIGCLVRGRRLLTRARFGRRGIGVIAVAGMPFLMATGVDTLDFMVGSITALDMSVADIRVVIGMATGLTTTGL